MVAEAGTPVQTWIYGRTPTSEPSPWSKVELEVDVIPCEDGNFFSDTWLLDGRLFGHCLPGAQRAVYEIGRGLTVIDGLPPDLFHGQTAPAANPGELLWQGRGKLWRVDLESGALMGPQAFGNQSFWSFPALSTPASRSHLYYSQLGWEANLWVVDLEIPPEP